MIKIISPGLLIGACFFIVSCGLGRGEAPLQISVNSWVGFGPLYIAEEHGLFEENGLNVEIVRMENAPDRRAALVADRIDVLGSTLDDLAVSLSQGIDAVAFACADYSAGGDGIIAAKGISSLEDLAKSEIAVQPGFVNHFFLLYVLDQNSIATESLDLSPMTPDDAGAAFIAGNVPAAVTWEPHLSEGLRQRPGSTVLVRSDAYPEAIIDVFIAQRQFVENKPESVNAFHRSWDAALRYMRENPDEAAVVIGRATGIAPNAINDMLSGAKLLTTEECADVLGPKVDSLSASIERLWREAGYVEGEIDLARAIKLQ